MNSNNKKELRIKAILNDDLLPLLVKTSIPTIIGMLVMVIYNLTDTFFVGILNNKYMTAAIGIVFSFMGFIQAIGFWFGYGSGNIMSKKIGENEEKEAEIISSIGILFAIVIGILIAVLSWFFILPLSRFIGGNASENLLNFTVEYLKVIIISIPFGLYSITLYNQLRLCGNVKDAMIGLLVGMAVNMLLDPVLMFGFKLGFIGAGYATLIGQITGCIVLTNLSEKNGNIAVDLKKVKLNKERVYHILAGGMPNFSRQSITSIALILLNVVAAKYGDSVIAALTISSRIVALAYMIMIGWGQGFQPICAMNYGAKQYDRVKKAFKISVIVGTVFLIVSAILLYVFSEPLIKAMSNDNEVILVGSEILRMQCITLPLLGYFAISSMLMQNIGQYFWASIISISRQGIFYIPLIYILSNMFGEFGIYLLQPVADVLSFVLAVILVRKIKFTNYKFKQDVN
ncbi:MATE family efflux transporter [Peptoniphilus indolicus]|uniref:Multidrug export protein MepA n=2 Tax=Peptoniphilus indolicus TaxID=33030 RepID=G4D417_9FIRM|nr:MATE family efflux transporter [Peptoniphilus indolicus]EGY79732.1 MATE efflux family protein [Peptoniphilus indolicus ATCC 29427]SUB75840.1 Multidrug export protein mepA [Peptoniphilus indolicus]